MGVGVGEGGAAVAVGCGAVVGRTRFEAASGPPQAMSRSAAIAATTVLPTGGDLMTPFYRWSVGHLNRERRRV
jgi:hypothetical protein